jgi:hypothetical protein
MHEQVVLVRGKNRRIGGKSERPQFKKKFINSFYSFGLPDHNKKRPDKTGAFFIISNQLLTASWCCKQCSLYHHIINYVYRFIKVDVRSKSFIHSLKRSSFPLSYSNFFRSSPIAVTSSSFANLADVSICLRRFIWRCSSWYF